MLNPPHNLAKISSGSRQTIEEDVVAGRAEPPKPAIIQFHPVSERNGNETVPIQCPAVFASLSFYLKTPETPVVIGFLAFSENSVALQNDWRAGSRG
jgi:hypothetical protein